MALAAPACFVIGHPIAHSRSPLIHRHWMAEHDLAGSYERIDVAPEALPGFIARVRAGEFAGGNVTLPHKQAVMPLLDALTQAAAATGAVNTVFHQDGRLIGDNTDITGFLAHLDVTAPGWEARVKKAVILGAGGAAQAIGHGLLTRGASRLVIANRDATRAAMLAGVLGPQAEPCAWQARDEAAAGADLLVNATSLGMKGQLPLDIDLSGMAAGGIVYDIVYVPLETPLLEAARAKGLVAVDGLGMLLHQAAPGFARWFGVEPKVTPQLRALIEADIVVAAAKS